MGIKILEDERIDQRIKDVLGQIDMDSAMTHFSTREEIMAFEQTEETKAARGILQIISNAEHYKAVLPRDGLVTVTKEFMSQPDGNKIKIQYNRLDTQDTLPCVYYIHGGGMEVGSCFDELYAAWGRCIAWQNVAVAMVDFRIVSWPSS